MQFSNVEISVKGGQGISCRRNIMNQDRKGERRYAVLHFGSNRNIKEKGG
jgi:hypothetical protein